MMPKRPLQALLATLAAGLLILMAASAHADKKAVIDSNTENALLKLRGHSNGTDQLLDKAFGVLVFPDVEPRAAHVGRLAAAALDRGEGLDPGELVPRYLRRAQAEVVRTGQALE